MPKIFLKQGSPEYDDEPKARTNIKTCEMRGCEHEATHKAPKHRGLNEYHNFCLQHVQEYNQAWNFFEGMADSEVEEHTINSVYGDRPTWKYTGRIYEDAFSQAWKFYQGHNKSYSKGGKTHNTHEDTRLAPEMEAMEVMGLKPPLDLQIITKRYRELAKKHHPDVNKGCKDNENLLKSINMAYTLLKVAYQNFEKLPDRK